MLKSPFFHFERAFFMIKFLFLAQIHKGSFENISYTF